MEEQSYKEGLYPPSSEDMVPVSDVANKPGSASIENSRDGGTHLDDDEITRLLSVGLSPEQKRAFMRARDEYINGVD